MFDLARSGPYFAGMLLVALVAFWPSYLSQLGANGAYTHLHAILATLWILLLIAQPTLAIQGARCGTPRAHLERPAVRV